MSLETGLITLGLVWVAFGGLAAFMNLSWNKEFNTTGFGYWKIYPSSAIIFFVLIIGTSPIFYYLGSLFT